MTIDAATVTDPLAFTSAMIVSCTVPEPDTGRGEVAYSTDTTYAAGVDVVSATTHRKYRSLQAGNLNKPLPVLPATETEWWRDIGATNRWASLDLDSTSATVGGTSETYEFAPGTRVSAIGLFGVLADSVRMETILDGETITDDTYNLRVWNVTTWPEVFTTPVRFRRAWWKLELPIHSDMHYRLTFARAAGGLMAGSIVLGTWEDLGEVRFGLGLGGDDYTLIERDPTGQVSKLVERRFVPNNTFETRAPIARIQRLREVKERLRGRVAMWLPISDPDDVLAESVAVLGIGRRFDIPTNETQFLFIPFEVEAL